MANPDRVAYSTTRPATKAKKATWRNMPDEQLLRMSTTTWKTAESLHPDENTMYRAVCGDQRAKAIINSWRPRMSWANLIHMEVRNG